MSSYSTYWTIFVNQYMVEITSIMEGFKLLKSMVMNEDDIEMENMVSHGNRFIEKAKFPSRLKTTNNSMVYCLR